MKRFLATAAIAIAVATGVSGCVTARPYYSEPYYGPVAPYSSYYFGFGVPYYHYYGGRGHYYGGRSYGRGGHYGYRGGYYRGRR